MTLKGVSEAVQNAVKESMAFDPEGKSKKRLTQTKNLTNCQRIWQEIKTK